MNTVQNGKIVLLAILLVVVQTTGAIRIKDIAYVQGVRTQQLIGYGLVVGLNGTGDTQRSTFTLQSVASMLKRFGITVPQDQLRLRNVAAVMVTASVPGFAKEGGTVDVIVSSMGDATSLQGGTLLLTPLSGIEGTVYARWRKDRCRWEVSACGPTEMKYDETTLPPDASPEEPFWNGRLRRQ